MSILREVRRIDVSDPVGVGRHDARRTFDRTDVVFVDSHGQYHHVVLSRRHAVWLRDSLIKANPLPRR